MPKQHTVIYKQSILDIAMRHYGNIDAVFDLIAKNQEIGLNKSLETGSLINLPESESFDKNMYDYLKLKQKRISTDAKYLEPASNWILITGSWRDTGIWEDGNIWIDN